MVHQRRDRQNLPSRGRASTLRLGFPGHFSRPLLDGHAARCDPTAGECRTALSLRLPAFVCPLRQSSPRMHSGFSSDPRTL
jgi:hypothetical protein